MDPVYVGLWVAWAVLTAVLFGVLEYRALTDDDDRTPPLTQVIKRWVPKWLTALVIGGFCFWFYQHLLG